MGRILKQKHVKQENTAEKEAFESRRSAGEEHSIQERLAAYGWSFFRLNVVLGVIFLAMFFWVIIRHKQDTDYFLALNEFYSQLEQMNNGLYDDILEGKPEGLGGVRQELERMHDNLGKLWRLEIGPEFWRDMDDLETMFQAYDSDVKDIYGLLERAGEAAGGKNSTAEIFALYENTQTAFSFLNRDFQKMYAQILTYVSAKEGRRWKENLVLLGLCIAVFVCWVRKKMKKDMQEIVENAELRDQARKSEIRALQMQINPHFLFNTLNTIARTADMEEAEGTVLLLEGTASLLRYTLGDSMQMVPLEKELEMLKNYVSIQENRFEERILFHFELDKSLHTTLVPRLILQPVLENAVIHGVAMKTEGARIEIRTFQSERGCVLSVTDNGVGIEAERLAKIREEIRRGSIAGTHIGLANIYARLRFFYGSRADFEIESTPGSGTEVRICIA